MHPSYRTEYRQYITTSDGFGPGWLPLEPSQKCHAYQMRSQACRVPLIGGPAAFFARSRIVRSRGQRLGGRGRYWRQKQTGLLGGVILRNAALLAGSTGPREGLIWSFRIYALTETPVVAVPDADWDGGALAPSCAKSCCSVL